MFRFSRIRRQTTPRMNLQLFAEETDPPDPLAKARKQLAALKEREGADGPLLELLETLIDLVESKPAAAAEPPLPEIPALPPLPEPKPEEEKKPKSLLLRLIG